MNTPNISFIFAYPLDVERRRLFQEKGLDHYPSVKEIKGVISHWKDTWNKLNTDDRIVLSMIKTTKRVPTRALECFVFGAGINPMSTPFLIPVMSKGRKTRSDEEFIQTVIHELIHIFVTEDTLEYWTMVRERYSDEEILTQNHIIIYAILKDLYELLFDKLPPDFSKNDLPLEYMRAIELVKEKGHKNILEEYYKFVK